MAGKNGWQNTAVFGADRRPLPLANHHPRQEAVFSFRRTPKRKNRLYVTNYLPVLFLNLQVGAALFGWLTPELSRAASRRLGLNEMLGAATTEPQMRLRGL